MAGGGLHAELASPDHDGRRDARESRCHMGEPQVSGREGQTFDGTSRWVTYVNFVKLPHTLFLLPFAMVGATLASYVAPVTMPRLGWIVIAFTSARFAAMGFNRIVD